MKRILWYGGTIITMKKDFFPEAVLSEGNTIIAAGSRKELIMQAGDAEQRDLHGTVLMPAFIDAHSHFTEVASGTMQADLSDAVDFAEIGRILSDFEKDRQLSPDVFLQARNFEPSHMKEGKNPSLAMLDAWTEHPLVLQMTSGHMGLFNSKAMHLLGITADTPDPEGGRIEKIDGKLTGYLEENAYFIYQKKLPMPGPNDFLQAFKKAERAYASYGIGTMQDGMLVEQMLPLYQMLLAGDMLTLDLTAYADMTAYAKAKTLFAQYSANKHVRLGGIKIFLDGSPQGRTAWMRAPYEGESTYCGYGTLKDGDVMKAALLAADEKTQLLAHCNGDAAAAQYIRCIAQAEKERPILKELRPVMIHAQLVGRDQLPQMVSLGIMPSFFIAHIYHWGDVHVQNFGMTRASYISPAGSALKDGAIFTFHQDSPVIPSNMLETVWCAVTRQTKTGRILGEEEKLSVWDALKAVTINAAYQYGEEKIKGTIEAGKRADFVILDQDPLTCDPEEIRKIRVLETVKNGETVFSL
jgi:predicted amidohydrolase YtcJ